MNESAKIQLHNGQYHALLNKNSRLAKKRDIYTRRAYIQIIDKQKFADKNSSLAKKGTHTREERIYR